MSELTPITRTETFLAKAGGQSVETPTPITREETFLQGVIDAIGSGGGGGGGGGVLAVNDVSGTLDKTWKEISDAFVDGAFVYVSTESGGLFIKASVTIIVTDNANVYGVGANNHQYIASTENGYPVAQ